MRASRRPIGETTWAVLACQLGLVVVVLGAWQLASGRLVKPLWISRPTDIFAQLWEWVAEGSLWPHLVTTLTEMLIGFVIGSTLGIVAGLVLGVLPAVATILNPLLTGLYAMPKVALAPLFILLFGIDLASKVALVAVTVFFLVFLNTMSGIREVDQDLADSLRLMGATGGEVFRKVMVPSAAIWVFNGLRISVRYALTAAVYGEIIASNQGVGFLVSYSKNALDTAGTFAALTVLALLGLTFTLLVARAETSSLKWKI